MSTSPNYIGACKNAQVQISTANANRDGTGTVGTLYTASGNGARIDDIYIKAQGTTTAGMIRFFMHDGTNYRLIHEELVSAITASATVAAFETRLVDLGWMIESGWSIRVSTEKAETFNIVVTKGGTF